MNTPEISVILPVYNGEKYLNQSIDSILKQSFENWELIVVNDCSVDSSAEIIESYSKADNRITVVNNPQNLKLPASLNVGFRRARGKYFTWTSDDNNYHNEAFKLMSDYLKQHEDVMVVSDMRYIDERGNVCGECRSFDKNSITVINTIGACFLYKKEVWDEIGEYNEELFLVEDYDYWLRILFRYGSIGHIPKVLYDYRRHNNSLTVNRLEDVQKGLLKMRYQYINQLLSLTDPEQAFELFYDFLRGGYDLDTIKRVFADRLPESCIVEKDDNKSDLILYGAGNYGRKALEYYKERVICFCDKDPQKKGIIIEDKEVEGIDGIKNYSNACVAISLARNNGYSALKFLYEHGIDRCILFQRS